MYMCRCVYPVMVCLKPTEAKRLDVKREALSITEINNTRIHLKELCSS